MTTESADINLGNITETVNNKADRDLQNTSYADLAQADYVIERGGYRSLVSFMEIWLARTGGLYFTKPSIWTKYYG